MSTFDAALRRAKPLTPTKKAKTKVLEIWEVQRWKLGDGWTETTWCDEDGIAQGVTQAEMQPPPGYAWEGGWTIVPPDCDGGAPWQGFGAWGWEYATSAKKLGARAPRRGLAFDRARRRRWQRVAKKRSTTQAADRERLLPKGDDRTAMVRKQLEAVQKLRRYVESTAKMCGTSHDSLELRKDLDEAAMKAGQLSADVGKLLDSSVAAPLGSKLSRDLYKEVAAIAAVVRSLPPLPSDKASASSSSGGGLTTSSSSSTLYGGSGSSSSRPRKRSPSPPRFVSTGRGALAPDDRVGPPQERYQNRLQMQKQLPAPQLQQEERREKTFAQEEQKAPDEELVRRINRKVRSISEQQVIHNIEEETHSAVQEVHTSILQINDIVKDLAMQVEIQQEMIDVVEANTAQAHDKVTSAKSQVVQAAEIQSSTPCIIS